MKHRTNRRGLTLLEVMIVVVIISLLASTAFPSLVKYMRRSRVAEATMNIRKLYDGSVIYFATAYSSSGGVLMDARFPESTPMKPASVPVRITVATPDWEAEPTWTALNFGLSDPHRYAYQYNSAGEGNSATFTISAFGDLDGDGIASTFVRFGTVHQMEVRGSGGIHEVNPLE